MSKRIWRQSADQVDLLTETFDIGQHQHRLFIVLCACGGGRSSFLVEYPGCDCMWVYVLRSVPCANGTRN